MEEVGLRDEDVVRPAVLVPGCFPCNTLKSAITDSEVDLLKFLKGRLSAAAAVCNGIARCFMSYIVYY